MPLTRKTPLKRTAMKRSTVPLKRVSLLSRSVTKQRNKDKPLKQPHKKLGDLKKEADKFFSLYIRYRDGRYTHTRGWETQCMTCKKWRPMKQMHAGHFISRAISDLRFDEENVNGQCYVCNVMRYGEQYLYAQALDVKYGEGTAARLAARRTLLHKFKRAELEQIISDAKTCIAHYLREEEANMKPKTKAKQNAKKPLNTAITNATDPANKKYQRRKLTIVQK